MSLQSLWLPSTAQPATIRGLSDTVHMPMTLAELRLCAIKERISVSQSSEMHVGAMGSSMNRTGDRWLQAYAGAAQDGAARGWRKAHILRLGLNNDNS